MTNNNNTKIFEAFQVDPSYQGDFLSTYIEELTEFRNNDLIITGNRDYNSYNEDSCYFAAATNLLNCYFESFFDDYEAVSDEEYNAENEEAIINCRDYLYNYISEDLSNNTITELLKLVIKTDSYYLRTKEKEAYFLEALTLITGYEWKKTTIHGYCQSDWQEVYYNSEKVGEAEIEALEAYYFNTGEEYEIDGCCYYVVHCHTYDAIREELAKAIGAEPENIKLKIFSGYTKTPIYEDSCY